VSGAPGSVPGSDAEYPRAVGDEKDASPQAGPTEDPTLDDEDADDDATGVIFSLMINSVGELPELAPFRHERRRPRPDDDTLYQIGTVSFEDDDWQSRAERLDAEVHGLLDRLDATGIDPTRLHDDDVLVRAYFTFDPGAETISAEVVARLARIHATIWIDATH